MPEQKAPAPAARLIAPRASLASCVRAYVARSTVHAHLAEPAQRLNRFPASPLCSITVFVRGEAEMVDPPPLGERSFDAFLFGGPLSRPIVTYNPGPVHAFMMMFYPPALHALAGIDLSAHVDRFCPLAEVLGPSWVALAQAIMDAPDDDARVALAERFLDPLWQAVRERDAYHGNAVGDWVRRLGVQAAAAGWGRGVRNIERRIKAWAGQPMRTLRRMRRAEQTFLDARADMMDGSVSWAEVAARAGYADQAHFCRETRAVTGLSPTELARAGREDESYWMYRIWS
jgi:AraC-like DNA-binding protein